MIARPIPATTRNISARRKILFRPALTRRNIGGGSWQGQQGGLFRRRQADLVAMARQAMEKTLSRHDRYRAGTRPRHHPTKPMIAALS